MGGGRFLGFVVCDGGDWGLRGGLRVLVRRGKVCVYWLFTFVAIYSRDDTLVCDGILLHIENKYTYILKSHLTLLLLCTITSFEASIAHALNMK